MIASTSLHDAEANARARVLMIRRWGRRFVVASTAGAGIVVVGWMAGSRAVAAPITGDHVIKANAAIALLVIGLTLLLEPRGARGQAALRVSAAGVTALGALTILQRLTGWSFGIDEALTADPWTAAELPAGRPAPLVAIVVVLLGLGVVLERRSPRLRNALLVMASVVSASTLLGHAFGAEASVALGDTYAVPVEASVLLTLLCVGATMTVQPSTLLRLLMGGSPNAALARRAATLAVTLPLIGGLAFNGLVEAGDVEERTAAWLVTVLATGCALVAVWHAIATVERMGTQLRTLMDTIPEGVYETRFDGTLLVANNPLGRLLGYRDADHLLAEVDNVTETWVHPEQREALVATIASGAAAGAVDIELRRRDGTTFVAELSFRAVTSAHEEPLGLRGTIRDVTEVRALDHEVSKAQERFRLSFHTGPLGRAVLDLRADPPCFAEVNAQLGDMLGYTETELLALDPRGLVHPRDLVVEQALLRAALAEPDGTIEYDGERRHRDGTWVPIHLSAGIARDRNGHALYALATIEDLRATLAAENELERTRQTLHDFVENVPAAVYMLDGDGRFLQLNQEGERIIGIPRREIIGRRRAEIPALGAAAHEHRRTDLYVMASGRSHMSEEHFGDGPDQRTFLSVKFPLHDTSGAITGIGGVSTDITELHRLRGEADRAWAETARRLATAVEYRDEETGAHIERMAAYCELIATHLNDPDLSPARIRAAAALHDAGKIAIPDNILLKPDTLTAAERAVMEAHTTIGHQLLSGTGQRELDLAASIAYTHHERWDGTGYPRRLHGHDIPLEGRIAAIADVFDALTGDRVYRKALSVQDAVAIMTDGSATAFDPHLLTLFLNHLDETNAIRTRWADRADPPTPNGRYTGPATSPSLVSVPDS